MYPNLEKELNANHMSMRFVAQAINMPESTFRDKLSKNNISVEEAFNIKNRLLPKYEMEYLFYSADESTETKSA